MPKTKTPQTIGDSATFTAYQCNNDDLFKNVARMYLSDGDKVADVTFGKGVFWKHVDTSRFDFFPSDLLTCSDRPYDFTALPYSDNEFDKIVFDPPYAHNPGTMLVDANYRNRETTKGFYHKDIINLYRKGMAEAKRCLKAGGLLFVKCQDEIESSKQCWSHIEIFDIAKNELAMTVQDLFVMLRKCNPVVQHKHQYHARKNHSYLWVFKK